MADTPCEEIFTGGSFLELSGDGYRKMGSTLYAFLDIGSQIKWKEIKNDQLNVKYFEQKIPSFFPGDELTNEDFFTLCGTFSSMVRRLAALPVENRKSALYCASASTFPSQCVQAGNDGIGKLLSTKNIVDNSNSKEIGRQTKTRITPAGVWSILFNPWRFLAEWTIATRPEITYEWIEYFDIKREKWTFACTSSGVDIIKSIKGVFLMGNNPELRISFDLSLDLLDKIEDGVVVKRRDIFFTFLIQHQKAVYAYFSSLFDYVASNSGNSFFLSSRIREDTNKCD